MRKVIRKYVTKTGELVTKTYTYAKNYHPKVAKLTTKKGEFTKKGEQILNKMLENINNNEQIEFYQNKVGEYQLNKKSLTKSQLEAMWSHNRISIFLANMQFDVHDIVDFIKLQGIEVDEAWILNESHWDFTTETTDARITLPNGKLILFNFNYEEHTYDIAISNEVW